LSSSILFCAAKLNSFPLCMIANHLDNHLLQKQMKLSGSFLIPTSIWAVVMGRVLCSHGCMQ